MPEQSQCQPTAAPENVPALSARAVDEKTARLLDATELLGLLQGPQTLPRANRALESRLADRPPEEHGRLHDAFLVIADDYWSTKSAIASAKAERAKAVAEVDRSLAAASRKAKKAAGAERAAAKKKELAEFVKSGWPESWRPAQARVWLGKGGDLQTVQSLSAAGWHAAEILELPQAMDISHEVAAPEGEADQHRGQRDRLVSLVTNEWPAAHPRTVLSLKRTLRSGKRERWSIFEVDDQFQLRQQSASRAGTWRTVRDEGAGTDLATAITSLAGLRTVRRSAINEYTLNQSRLTPVDLLGLLHVSAAGGGEDSEGWPAELTEHWSNSDEAVTYMVGSTPVVNRWCTIDDYRLVATQLGRKTVPILVDFDAGQPVGAEALAEYTWFSESGGAPISWDGGNSLSVVSASLVFARQWGDMGARPEFSSLPATPRGWAGLIAHWVTSIDAAVPAAFALEPFDPKGTLSQTQHKVWEGRFEALEASISLDFAPDVLTLLGARLRRNNSLYLQTRNALRRPRGKDGRALATALDTVLEGGALGQLLWGNWKD